MCILSKCLSVVFHKSIRLHSQKKAYLHIIQIQCNAVYRNIPFNVEAHSIMGIAVMSVVGVLSSAVVRKRVREYIIKQ